MADKKVSIQLENVVKYDETVVVIQPEGMTDEEFEKLTGQAEKRNRYNGNASEFAESLRNLGFAIHEEITSFPDSPTSQELEIVDVRDIKE